MEIAGAGAGSGWSIGWAPQGLPGPRAIDLEASVARLRELLEEALGHTSADVTGLLEPALIASEASGAARFAPQGQIHRIGQSGDWIVPATAQQPERPASPEE